MHRLLACFGNCEFGRLGFGNHLTSQYVPRLAVSLARFDLKSVACGGSHTGEAGQVHTFGCNVDGQLGLADYHHAGTTRPMPVDTLKGQKVVSVAAGTAHTLAATEDGAVYAWGSTNYGCLGLGADAQADGERVWQPARVKGLDGVKIRSVYAGSFYSGALDEEGMVYMWGRAAQGQLGVRGADEAQREPRLVEGLRKISKLSLGAMHTLATRKDGRTLLWGSDQLGSLGQGRSGMTMRSPQIFKYWMTDVGAGARHSAGVTEDGRLYTWGWGGAQQDITLRITGPTTHAPRTSHQHLALGAGQLGVGNGVSLYSPTIVVRMETLDGSLLEQHGGDPFNYMDENLCWKYVSVACGPNHTAALVELPAPFAHHLATTGRMLVLEDENAVQPGRRRRRGRMDEDYVKGGALGLIL